MAQRLADARGPTCLLVPSLGVDEWDRPAGPMHMPHAQKSFVRALLSEVRAPTEAQLVPAHINDAAFCDAALTVYDRWVAEGRVCRGALMT